MVQKVGRPDTFAIYAVICVATAAFIAKTVPETKRELLESIQV